MKALGLKFRVDDLTATPRTVAGVLSQAVLDETLPGLIGKLGYRPLGDAAIDAEVYLSAGAEIVVKGMVKVAVGFDCSRCLSDGRLDFESEHEHVLVRRKARRDGDAELVITDEDEDPDLETYDGDEVDLSEVFRQDLVLTLPMNPTCADAGAEECVMDHDAKKALDGDIDPRWAPLLELKKKMN